nr:hypothetical protein [Tanacetum cinerariifolium]
GRCHRPRAAAAHAAVAAIEARPTVHLRHPGKLRAQHPQSGRVPGRRARAAGRRAAPRGGRRRPPRRRPAAGRSQLRRRAAFS